MSQEKLDRTILQRKKNVLIGRLADLSLRGNESYDKMIEENNRFLKENPSKYVFKRLLFKSFASAVNVWINFPNTPISEIEPISRNLKAEKLCGIRTEQEDVAGFPFEIGYYCPICSKPFTNACQLFNEKEVLELTKLNFSEYNYFFWCESCNIDIPEFLCANVRTKGDVVFYTKRYLNMIKKLKNPDCDPKTP